MSDMRRREFTALVGGVGLLLAVKVRRARAQQPGKLPTIGFLGALPSIENQRVAAFVQRLRELGWVDGRNLAIEYRWAEGRNERYAETAADLVRLKVDVIVTVASRQSKRQRSSLSCSRRCRTRSGPAWSRVWRDRAATSPVWRTRCLILVARSSNSCARSYPVFAGWRSWPMRAIPAPCWI